jgi:cytochrome c553
MKSKIQLVATIFMTTMVLSSPGQASVVEELIVQYQQQGASAADAQQGKQQWIETHTNNNEGEARSCSACHTKDLHAKGKHVNTGKVIDPLAPSVNAERLTDVAKIEKWFKRNCKWTLGRECSVQEKSNFLSFIKQQ